MTARTADRPLQELSDGLLSFGVEAATTILAGVIVGINSSGYLVEGTATSSIRVVGLSDEKVVNTVAAGYGSAGQLRCRVRTRPQYLAQTGTTITIADVGEIVYLVDNQTISISDAGGTRPPAGRIVCLPPSTDTALSGLVCVALGEPSLFDAPDNTSDPYSTVTFRARNVIMTNVSDLTAYTVAASEQNDNVLGVAGDVVLLTAQSTAAQNGPYVIGTVAAGVAPLTRVVLAASETFLASQYKAQIAAGTLYAGSEWKNAAAGTTATDDPQFRAWLENPQMRIAVQARNVLNANVADLSAYTVAANASNNDNVLGVEGDIVLAIAQSTAAQNGLYRIGTVAAGVAPLRRLDILPSGKVIQDGQVHVSVSAGDVYSDTEWKNTAAGTVGTNDPLFFPRAVSRAVTLVAGTATITNIPLLSATKSGISLIRITANTCAATDGGYHVNGAPTAGALGTASIPVFATVLAGTINNADISTLRMTVTNW